MPNGSRCPFTKVARSYAPPVFCGSRITTISPAPESARKISPFGAIVSQRGYLNFVANTFIWNPFGTVGRNPAGGFPISGALLADFVMNGAGSFGFWPCVTCAGAIEDSKNVKAKVRMFRARIAVPFLKIRLSSRTYNASDAWPVPNDSFPQANFGDPTGRSRMPANSPEAVSLRTSCYFSTDIAID